jgi:hypothetical protein
MGRGKVLPNSGWDGRVDGRCVLLRVGRTSVNAAASTTLSRHGGVIAQLVFHNPLMPSDGMDMTTSAAGSRLATIKHLFIQNKPSIYVLTILN